MGIQTFFDSMTAKALHLVIMLLKAHERVQVDTVSSFVGLVLLLVVNLVAVRVIEHAGEIVQRILGNLFDVSLDRCEEMQIRRVVEIL